MAKKLELHQIVYIGKQTDSEFDFAFTDIESNNIEQIPRELAITLLETGVIDIAFPQHIEEYNEECADFDSWLKIHKAGDAKKIEEILRSEIKKEILTLEEAEEKDFEIIEYDNGDYSYVDENGFEHLIKNGGKKEVCGSRIWVFDSWILVEEEPGGTLKFVSPISLKPEVLGKWKCGFDEMDIAYEGVDGKIRLITEDGKILEQDQEAILKRIKKHLGN